MLIILKQEVFFIFNSFSRGACAIPPRDDGNAGGRGPAWERRKCDPIVMFQDRHQMPRVPGVDERCPRFLLQR
jgi:hypothetical protein